MSKAITATLANSTITTTVEVCVAFFLPTDARHWIPNGTAWITLEVDALDLEDDESATLEHAAEQWCEQTHGKGSFWGLIWED